MIKKHLLLLLWSVCFVFASHASSEKLYSESFGEEQDPAVIFLHGGPGYNSFSFEASVAEGLANVGFFVIVFDQRGCGRSKDISNSKYTFEEAFENLKSIYERYGVEKASLLGGRNFRGQVR